MNPSNYTVSATDLYSICSYLQPFIVNGRIDQIYQYEQKQFLFRFHKSGVGKTEVYIELPRFFFQIATKPPIDSSAHFGLLLRKLIGGLFVQKFEQCGFDRRILLQCAIRDVTFNIYLELFDKGNIIICDANNVIMHVQEIQQWTDRSLQKGQQYTYAPRPFPNEYSVEDLQKLFQTAQMPISKFLASIIGFGGTYAKHVCQIAGCDPQSTVFDAKIHQSIAQLFKILDAKAIIAQAQNEFGTVAAKKDPKLIKFEKEKAKVEAILTSQKESLAHFEQEIINSLKTAQYIQSHYDQIKTILDNAQALATDKSKQMKELNRKDRTITVEIDTV